MIKALQLLKYLQQKPYLEWMEELQVVEDGLIAEAQTKVLADLMYASENEQPNLIACILGDSDSDTWVVGTN